MNFIAGLTKFSIALVFCLLTMVYRGFMLSSFWGWFIVPLGVRAISTVEAIGISFVFSGLLLNQIVTLAQIENSVDPSETDDYFSKAVSELVKSLFFITAFFFFGWLWHLYAA